MWVPVRLKSLSPRFQKNPTELTVFHYLDLPQTLVQTTTDGSLPHIPDTKTNFFFLRRFLYFPHFWCYNQFLISFDTSSFLYPHGHFGRMSFDEVLVLGRLTLHLVLCSYNLIFRHYFPLSPIITQVYLAKYF